MALTEHPIFSHLRGKTALVTGSNGPVGAALCKSLLASGVTVWGTDVDLRPPVEIAAYHPADLSSRKGITSLMGWIEQLDGEASLLVNNAALTPEGLGQLDLSEDDLVGFERIMRVNVSVPYLLTNHLIRVRRFTPDAAVVNIGSIYGVVSPKWKMYEGTQSSGSVAYSVSKAAVIHLTRAHASRYATQLRINSISPGGIERSQDDKFIARYSESTPSEKMLTEADVVHSIAFLSNPTSNAGIRGHNLLVDDGYTVW